MDQIEKPIEDKSTAAKSSPPKIELKKVEDKNERPTTNDKELDITSEDFNPLKALYAPDFRATEKVPKIIYQNMAAFETALKKFGILGLNKKPINIQASGSKNKNTLLVKEEKTQRRFEEHQMAIRTQSKVKTKHQRNLLAQMNQADGPLKQLQQFVSDGRTIKVLIRKEHGIKGYVEGVLKMFDRHWNLLLVDVMECLEQRKYKYAENKLVTHQEPQDCYNILQQLGIKLPKQSVKSLGRKRIEIKRNLPQLMLRGEHVVLVSAKLAI